MTFDQFMNFPPDQYVWFEIRGGSIERILRSEYDGDATADNEREAYNKQGRCWLSEPSEIEMLSEPWDEYESVNS
jgi:hypothetical protein